MAHFIDDRLGSIVEHMPDDWRERIVQMTCKTAGTPDPVRLHDPAA
jgi:hypothetical protein